MIINIRSKEKNENLLELLRQSGHYIPAYCSGKGICGKCKVRFLNEAPEPTDNEKQFLSDDEMEHGWRLACKTVFSGECYLELPACEEEAAETVTGFQAAMEEVDQNDKNEYAAVFDIGTTTLAASKVDIRTKKVIKTVASINHQRMYGADVISRMEASNQGKGEELQKLIQKDLEELLQSLELPSEETKMIISCNTTMGHLLQGYSCKTLGMAPYTPVDISLHEYKNMTMLPGISTYVGADIVSGIIACGMNLNEKFTILVDIGTNGEMVIGNKNRMIAASTAAGPVFEGGNIRCGMAGVPGAITSVTLKDDGLDIKTIGEKDPIGICGSGVLEMTYELWKNNLIDETGLLSDKYFDNGYPLGKNLVFTQKDIREVQMAKSAIRTGIEILIREYGIGYDEIDKFYLAGGFGQHINVKKAVGIGLLPKELEEKVVVMGNTSLQGAILYAIDEEAKKQFGEVTGKVKEISLAKHQAFQDLYMTYMSF